MRTEIPADLLSPMLYASRIARLRVNPGVSEYKGIDMFDLSAHWAETLFAMAHDPETAQLDQEDMDQVAAVFKEGVEIVFIEKDFEPVPLVDEVLAFLTIGE